MKRLNHSPAHILREVLLSDPSLINRPSDIGEWPSFIGMLPDTPDDAVVFHDTGGILDGRSHRSGETYDHPGAQIRVRAVGHTEGFAKASAIGAAIDEIINAEVTIESSTYRVQSVTIKSGVIRVGEDEKRRDNFTLNVILSIEEILT